jgi:hypothetical protein
MRMGTAKMRLTVMELGRFTEMLCGCAYRHYRTWMLAGTGLFGFAQGRLSGRKRDAALFRLRPLWPLPLAGVGAKLGGMDALDPEECV